MATLVQRVVFKCTVSPSPHPGLSWTHPISVLLPLWSCQVPSSFHVAKSSGQWSALSWGDHCGMWCSLSASPPGSTLFGWLLGSHIPLGSHLSQWPFLFHLRWFFSFTDHARGWDSPGLSPWMTALFTWSGMVTSASLYADSSQIAVYSLDLSPEFQLHTWHPHLDVSNSNMHLIPNTPKKGTPNLPTINRFFSHLIKQQLHCLYF